jgi:hypothetical protein
MELTQLKFGRNRHLLLDEPLSVMYKLRSVSNVGRKKLSFRWIFLQLSSPPLKYSVVVLRAAAITSYRFMEYDTFTQRGGIIL